MKCTNQHTQIFCNFKSWRESGEHFALFIGVIGLFIVVSRGLKMRIERNIWK